MAERLRKMYSLYINRSIPKVLFPFTEDNLLMSFKFLLEHKTNFTLLQPSVEIPTEIMRHFEGTYHELGDSFINSDAKSPIKTIKPDLYDPEHDIFYEAESGFVKLDRGIKQCWKYVDLLHLTPLQHFWVRLLAFNTEKSIKSYNEYENSEFWPNNFDVFFVNPKDITKGLTETNHSYAPVKFYLTHPQKRVERILLTFHQNRHAEIVYALWKKLVEEGEMVSSEINIDIRNSRVFTPETLNINPDKGLIVSWSPERFYQYTDLTSGTPYREVPYVKRLDLISSNFEREKIIDVYEIKPIKAWRSMEMVRKNLLQLEDYAKSGLIDRLWLVTDEEVEKGIYGALESSRIPVSSVGLIVYKENTIDDGVLSYTNPYTNFRVVREAEILPKKTEPIMFIKEVS